MTDDRKKHPLWSGLIPSREMVLKMIEEIKQWDPPLWERWPIAIAAYDGSPDGPPAEYREIFGKVYKRLVELGYDNTQFDVPDLVNFIEACCMREHGMEVGNPRYALPPD